MYALVDYIGNQILIKEGEKIKIPFLNQISRKSSTISGIILCIVGIYLLIYWLTDLKFQGNII